MFAGRSNPNLIELRLDGGPFTVCNFKIGAEAVDVASSHFKGVKSVILGVSRVDTQNSVHQMSVSAVVRGSS